MALAEDLRQQNAKELEQVSDLVDELERAGPDQGPDGLRHKLSAYLAQRRERLAAALKSPPTPEPGEKASEAAGAEADAFADRKAFLRMKAWLLDHCRDEFVAFVGGQLVAHHPTFGGLTEEVRRSHPTEDAYVERVDEAAFQERPPADVGGVCEAGPIEDEREEGVPVTDRESFFRMKDRLLSLYRGKFVAFAGGRVAAASPTLEGLCEMVDAMSPRPEVCVERVDEAAFEGAPFHVVTCLLGVREATRKV